LVAWAAVQGGDRIGAIGSVPGLNAEVKPGGGPRGALRVLRALAEWTRSRRAGGAIVPLSQACAARIDWRVPASRALAHRWLWPPMQRRNRRWPCWPEHCDVAALACCAIPRGASPPPARYALRTDSGQVLLDFGGWRDTAATR